MLSLMNNCDFDQYQAEQVAIITTCNGKCPIRTGIREDLEPLANALTEEGLTVKLV